MPTMKDSLQVPLKAGQRAPHELQEGPVGLVPGNIIEKMRDTPFDDLSRFKSGAISPILTIKKGT
jgi:hypothetical protein